MSELPDGRAGAESRAWMERAQARIPGGVNSPVRAYSSVGGQPPFIRSARGCRIETQDGVELIDYVGSWGPAILGHAHPEVVQAVQEAAERGLSFGAATAAEVELAELICELVPGLHGGKVRLVSSGTEATMSALRLARGITGRDQIVKCDGGYHGHADCLLVAAGSGAATLGIPGSAGVPAGAVGDTHVVPYNDLEAVRELFERRGSDIAALIIEPIAGNMGCVPPEPGYLEGLREACDAHGVLLIFDEVMTGFRVALGGAQAHYNVRPDLTCLGKVVGGGMPVGAYGGSAEHMARIAPLGPVYQAGTLSGNPLSVAAGLKTLQLLQRDQPHEALASSARRLCDGLREAAGAAGIPLYTTYVGGMFGFSFHAGPVRNYSDAKAADTETFARFFQGLLARGVHVAPSAFEAGFLSMAHDDNAIEQTLSAARGAFAEAAEGAA